MTSSGYRGKYATAILVLVLFLEPCCHCMPVSNPAEREDTAVRDRWWHLPCDIGEELTTKRQPAGPGGQLKSWRRTQTQMKIAGFHYKGLALKDMYSEVVGVLEEAYNYDWLPQNQLEWFKKRFGKFENIQEVGPKVLLALHIALQRFAVTLDKLYRHHHSDTEHHQFYSQRRQILDGLCKELKKLLCEVEQSLATAGGVPPVSPLGETDLIPSDRWDNRHDKTAILVQDWGVLRYYERFLDDWTYIVDDLLKSASTGKKNQTKQKGQRNGKKGRGNRGQGAVSQDADRSREERGGGRVRTGRKSGAGARRTRGGNGNDGKRRGGKGRKRATKKHQQEEQKQKEQQQE